MNPNTAQCAKLIGEIEGRVEALKGLLLAPEAKPAEPEEAKYREVTEADVGKVVEVQDEDSDFERTNPEGTLGMIDDDGNYHLKNGTVWEQARIRITPEKTQQFKVGDWVVCRESHNDLHFTDTMITLAGEAFQVILIDPNDPLKYKLGNRYWYRPEWLSPATPAEIAAAQK